MEVIKVRFILLFIIGANAKYTKGTLNTIRTKEPLAPPDKPSSITTTTENNKPMINNLLPLIQLYIIIIHSKSPNTFFNTPKILTALSSTPTLSNLSS